MVQSSIARNCHNREEMGVTIVHRNKSEQFSPSSVGQIARLVLQFPKFKQTVQITYFITYEYINLSYASFMTSLVFDKIIGNEY